ncbi:selenium metabolism protein YedF [Breznakibacter xylanolyticus]|uniref:Selenium metabolism protein YedF n=1 Tax=Breznakibacter xylanolyticus TaxID=990 RepID=A0A2W7NF06_9BACT|nr:sulfurtransferase-like selenium metabolism protein YedF [Breznakibacter xylanolyticus]MBN2742492.1 sulfurtransferase-like selenium metabolism protein YedF [Marinilabiliaceae bacterium]PZX15304.1 selenium metabolism protein YedF [Breznakibacter xylanolyticus]
MPIIDTRGQLCPKPLIMAKQVFNTLEPGQIMEVLTDHETSLSNLMNFFTALKAIPVSEKHDDGWHVYATKPLSGHVEPVNPEAFCQTSNATPTGKHVVCLTSNLMGKGDDQLGALLMRGFINALAEQDVLPSHIICYNGAVKLAIKGTDTLTSLITMENQGVNIILCGTCVDFFDIKPQIGTGTISNMYQITQILSQASKVIYP